MTDHNNINFGNLFPVSVINSDGSINKGSIEYNKNLGKDIYSKIKNQIIFSSAQPIMDTYVKTNKIIVNTSETTKNIFMIVFFGFWLLIALITLFIFAIMYYNGIFIGNWFLITLVILIIIPIILLLWISSIYNNTYNDTKNNINNIITNSNECLNQIYDGLSSLNCFDNSCTSLTNSTCTKDNISTTTSTIDN